MSVTIHQGNTVAVEVAGFKNKSTGVYLNSASTRTAHLVDENGDTIAGSSIVLTLKAGSTTGDYAGAFPETLDVLPGDSGQLHVDLAEGAVVAHWEIPFEVKQRSR